MTEVEMRPVLSTVSGEALGRLNTMAKPRGGDGLDDQMRARRRLGVDIVVCAPSSAELEALGWLVKPQPHSRPGMGPPCPRPGSTSVGYRRAVTVGRPGGRLAAPDREALHLRAATMQPQPLIPAVDRHP